MPSLSSLFVTKLYRAELGRAGRRNGDVKAACLAIAAEDRAGQSWSAANGYRGYTSYASLDDLTWRAPVLSDLIARIDGHVTALARSIDLDLGRRRRLVLDSFWINILEPGGHHTAHIHPHSVVSGTYYADVPAGAGAIRFEDPRHGFMMAAPPRRAAARLANRTFIDVAPKAGTLLLWESWLRHEVPVNKGRRARISLSFNYRQQRSAGPARGSAETP